VDVVTSSDRADTHYRAQLEAYIQHSPHTAWMRWCGWTPRFQTTTIAPETRSETAAIWAKQR